MDKFLEAEFFWDKKLKRILTETELERASFQASVLDLEKRGYLKLEDLSCFINLYASGSSNFKKRSVVNLFSRFTRPEHDPEKLSYNGFIKKLCSL